QEVSGFCLVDDEFPLIYLNNTNTKTRQVFTLHHELAHLLLKVSTITVVDDSYMDSLAPKDKRIERFCNALAAEILVPSSDFSAQVANLTTFDEDTVECLADRYRVSRETVLRRLLDTHLVSQKYYREKVSEWNKQTPKKGAGGNYYLTQATYLGEAYLRLVFGKLYQGRLTHSQAAEHLGVKTKNLAGLEEVVLGKGLSA
ncbi:MAG: ImmA/IrrE family metallo-endopeptidase, partial [FCB group bacterium]|nr:ImmA/IrrE family metallo-endopeptidase [FCB group bacterium]